MTSVSSSSPVCYISNLSMPSSSESLLSWNVPATSTINLNGYGVEAPVFFVPENGTIKVSELVLMGLQKFYTCKPLFKATPSRTCVNLVINEFNSTACYILRADITHDLNKIWNVNLIWHSTITQRQREVFGANFEIVKKIIHRADQFLISLLKKEERDITYSEFSNITKDLTSCANIANTSPVQASSDWNVKKDSVIDRLDFLFYSLIFFRKNLLPDEEYNNRITAVVVKTKLPKDVADIIIKYEFSKIINPKMHIHSRPPDSDSSRYILS